MARFMLSTAVRPSLPMCRARKVAPAPFRMFMMSSPAPMNPGSYMP